MQNRIEILNNLNLGEFIEINDIEYKSENGDAIVVNRTEMEDLIKERLKDEIPFLDNEILKKHLPEKYQIDIVLDDYKELSKFDNTMLFNSIIDPDLFFIELIGPESNIAVSELLLSNSQFVYGDDDYMIFYTPIEIETN